MSVTPTGMLSLPLANLRTALSNCAAFQTWVSAASAAAALTSIGLVERAVAAGNFAVIDDGDDYNIEALDSGATFHDEGSLILLFQGPVGSGNVNSEVDAQFEFTNSIGAILQDLWDYCGNNRNVFSLAGMSKTWGPARPDSTERASADYIQIGFSVKWK